MEDGLIFLNDADEIPGASDIPRVMEGASNIIPACPPALESLCINAEIPGSSDIFTDKTADPFAFIDPLIRAEHEKREKIKIKKTNLIIINLII